MNTSNRTVDEILAEAVSGVVARAAGALAKRIADMVATRLDEELGTPPKRRQLAGPIEEWTPDRRARRVPTFVIEMTGLATKKQVVAKYGPEVVFRKGERAPKPER